MGLTDMATRSQFKKTWILGLILVMPPASNLAARGQTIPGGSTVVIGTPHGPAPSLTERVLTRTRVVLRPVFDPFRDALGRLRSRHDPSRRDGALTLGRIGDPRAVPDLVWLLQNDRDREVREAAALALGAIGDARALNALHHAAVSDRHRKVRQAAHHAHGKILFAAPVVSSSTVVIEPGIRTMAPAPVEIEPVPSPALTPSPAPRVLESRPAEPEPPLRLQELPPPLPAPADELPLRPNTDREPEPWLEDEHAGEVTTGPRLEPSPTSAPPLEPPGTRSSA